MKFKAIVFLLVGYCTAHDMPKKGAISENHIFVLVACTEDSGNVVTGFEVKDLVKSNFPVGPLRYNKVHESQVISNDNLKDIEANSWELPLLCVEDKSGKLKTKCGFESVDHHQLAYVFNIPDGAHDIKGYIILRTLFSSILERAKSEQQSLRSLTAEEAQEIGGIDVEEDEFWDEEPPELEHKAPTTFAGKLYEAIAHNHTIQKSMLWALMKYVEIKSWLTSPRATQ